MDLDPDGDEFAKGDALRSAIKVVFILTEASVVEMAVHHQAVEDNWNHGPSRCNSLPRISNHETTAQNITAKFRSAASGLGHRLLSPNLP